MCMEIRSTLISAIDEATEKLNYIPDRPIVSFLCEEHMSSSLHPATMSKVGSELICSKDLTHGGSLTAQHKVWLGGMLYI